MDGEAPSSSIADHLTRQRLEREVQLLSRHRDAIEASRVWRCAQFLRRLVGRAW
jgi:hypothetical protein